MHGLLPVARSGDREVEGTRGEVLEPEPATGIRPAAAVRREPATALDPILAGIDLNDRLGDRLVQRADDPAAESPGRRELDAQRFARRRLHSGQLGRGMAGMPDAQAAQGVRREILDPEPAIRPGGERLVPGSRQQVPGEEVGAFDPDLGLGDRSTAAVGHTPLDRRSRTEGDLPQIDRAHCLRHCRTLDTEDHLRRESVPAGPQVENAGAEIGELEMAGGIGQGLDSRGLPPPGDRAQDDLGSGDRLASRGHHPPGQDGPGERGRRSWVRRGRRGGEKSDEQTGERSEHALDVLPAPYRASFSTICTCTVPPGVTTARLSAGAKPSFWMVTR